MEAHFGRRAARLHRDLRGCGPSRHKEASMNIEYPTRTEPWSQTVLRVLSPEGLIIGVSYTPPLHS
jgi:hypothetical protein